MSSADGLLIEAALIFLLILLNGFFSGSEIAFISSKRSVINKLSKEGNRSAKIVSQMKSSPDRFLATIQVGVTLVGTLASVVGGVVATEHLKPFLLSLPFAPVQQWAELISVGVVVVVISYTLLVLGELVPKSIALRHAERIACFAARPIELFTAAASVAVKILTVSTSFVVRLLGVKGDEKHMFITEEDIRYYIKEGRDKGILEETEADLLHGVFEFADTTVREIMVPKPKLKGIEVSTPPEQVLHFMAETGYSRYPVYRETLEQIVGVLFNKDVFSRLEAGKPIVLSELMRPPYFVPNTVMISRLLREMQRRKVHMAIVLDEHGDVDGLVTIEDILEEIVGEIEDEYETNKNGIVEKLKDGSLIIDASASLRELENYGFRIEESDDYNTLAGFMLSRLQRIPRGGEFVVYRDHRFTVVDVEENRIRKVKAEALASRQVRPGAGGG
ncbi:MAG TPA: HlyC/CorC family transporter [Deltaproteobacteria bacterium]|nr:HlyC/CorC family transporter [Deltaproteobacteria bacterium]